MCFCSLYREANLLDLYFRTMLLLALLRHVLCLLTNGMTQKVTVLLDIMLHVPNVVTMYNYVVTFHNALPVTSLKFVHTM